MLTGTCHAHVQTHVYTYAYRTLTAIERYTVHIQFCKNEKHFLISVYQFPRKQPSSATDVEECILTMHTLSLIAPRYDVPEHSSEK